MIGADILRVRNTSTSRCSLPCLIAFLFVSMISGSTSLSAQSAKPALQAGAAMSNITPFLDGGIVGNFGVPPAAKYIHDELYAKCLVLDDGREQIAIVIVDNLSVNREVFDHARELVEKHTGMKKGNVLMAATHTHSSVSASSEGDERMNYNYDNPLDEYQLFVARRIADGVRRAIHHKEPAKIGWGAVDIPQHVFNRRWIMKPGVDVPNPFGGQDKARMNPGVGNPDVLKPAGPTDPQVSFLSVQALDGRPIALLANYSLHYVGGVPMDHITSDYFGVFADHFQQLIGADRKAPAFVAMMSNGTSGDINNIDVKGPPDKMGSYQKMQVVAKDVAAQVFKQYGAIEYKTDVALGAAWSDLKLAVRKPAPELLARAKKVVADPSSVTLYHPLEPTYARRSIQMAERWPEQIDAMIQTLRIGDLAIAAIPFETFAEIGLEIKAKSPFKSTFTIELANGSYGYLPTPGQHELGGYETWLGTNRVEKEASTKIVNRLLEQLKALKR